MAGITAALGAAGAVGGLVGGIADAASGGGGGGTSQQQNTQTQKTLGQGTESGTTADVTSERELRGLFEGLNNQSNTAQGNSSAIDNIFRDALIKFSTGTGQPSADQVAQATSYVDQTFTAPAQQQYGKFLNQAQEASTNRAAALGRNSTDPAFTREFAAQAGQAAQDLSNQRGNLIAQRSDYLANQQPLNQLNALYQGSQYFNTPLNQAMQNRLSLLNAATGVQNNSLSRQINSGGQTTLGLDNKQDNASIGSQIANLGGQVTKLGAAIPFGGPTLNGLGDLGRRSDSYGTNAFDPGLGKVGVR